YINNILFNYLNNFYTTYLDNILIYSKNKLDYKEYIKKTNLKKYKFKVKYTKYLGFIITIDSIKVNLEKVSIIKYKEFIVIVKGIVAFRLYNIYNLVELLIKLKKYISSII
ncbi:hypothetical protein OIDMADRAFT_132452, partial [Oidiodendron maius Zn]